MSAVRSKVVILTEALEWPIMYGYTRNTITTAFKNLLLFTYAV